MTDLLACPFCGGEAERYDDHDTGSFNDGGSCIQCKQCQASSPMHFDRKENLYRSWNDRTPTCGFSCDGINLHGDKASIDAAFDAFHSHSQIEDLRRNLRHWREECGKLHAKLAGCGADVSTSGKSDG